MNQNENHKPDIAISPWRAAKPRKPLSEMRISTPNKLTNSPGEDISPPNSSNKESTRLETSQRSPVGQRLREEMELSHGASPAMAREQELNTVHKKSKTAKEVSFTHLKYNSSNNHDKVKANQTANLRDSKEKMEVTMDNDQPSARCKYVGNNSHNNLCLSSTNHSIENSTRRQTSIRESSFNSFPNDSTRVQVKENGWSPLNWFLVFSLGLGASLIYNHIQQNNLLNQEQHTAKYWKQMRQEVKEEIYGLKAQFPNQKASGFWTQISSGLRSPMHVLPDYPGVLILLSNPRVKDTANCLASRLVNISSKVLINPRLTPPHPLTLRVDCSQLSNDPNIAKEQLAYGLHISLSSGHAVALLGLEQLDPSVALLLHAFTDNSNAPYKQAVLVMVLDIEEIGGQHCNLEQKAEEALSSLWYSGLGSDKLGSLLSRLVVNVVQVQEETESSAICD